MTNPTSPSHNAALSVLCLELGAVCDRLGTDHLKDKLEILSKRIASEILNLVVFGEFKRGKSTLINALLGCNVLPVGVIPVTSVVTIIQYGEQPGARIAFDDKETVDCSIDEMENFISEAKNPNNEKRVHQALVSFPSPSLKRGVQIVDTPGVGSIHAHNTDVTERFMPNADAAIIVFAADQPATRAELQFLTRMRRYAVKFFFVQNKSDQLDESDKQESRNFVQDAIGKEFGESHPVYQISAKQALKSMDKDFVRFRDELFSFLELDRAAIIEAANARRVEMLANEVCDFIRLKQSGLELQVQELAQAAQRFGDSIESLKASIDKAEHLATGRCKRLVSEISKSLDPFVNQHNAGVKDWTRDLFEQNKHLPLPELGPVMVAGLKIHIAETLSPWRDEQEALIKEQFKTIVQECGMECEKIVRDISTCAQKYLGASLRLNLELPELTRKTSTYFTVDDPFTLSIQAIPLLLSGPFAKQRILERFLRSADEELVRNGGRLRADFQHRIEESTRQFLASLKALLNKELSQLEFLLDQLIVLRQSNDCEIEREKSALKEAHARVEEVRKTLGERLSKAADQASEKHE